MELNPKIKIIIVIGIIILLLSGIPFKIIKDTVSPPKIINQSLNVTPTPIIIYKNVTVLVTPTPDGKTYFAGEYQTGLRRMGRLFSWYHENATGFKDMSGHVKIYDYRFFSSIHIFNPTDYRYYQVDSSQDKKFLFVFVKIYLDNIIGKADSLWLPNEYHYYVSAKNTLYNPIQFEKRLRIRELEETWNDNGDFRIGYYGVFNTYSREIQYASTAGEVAQPIYYVKGGESNAIDGYIVYEIPYDINENDINIIGDMYAFGQPSWTLKI
jgi:hypothetical protein